ncbi:B-cell receptor CD22-like [Limanda limanda]|uniref:B-cell receptor CD22-like n=1 Tax=Limanda limanda TaxID=27771 RepID=UPI0029C63034|nr:B-cell receptor CD22-like [Limanda limanda]
MVPVIRVVRSQNGWSVSYTSTEICAFRGLTVDITCTYKYPSWLNHRVNTVQKTFWFIKVSNGNYVDLKTDTEYSGRVENLCGNNKCTLRISNLRESDSAVYKFRFTTNQPGGSFYGPAGITLSVTDPQLQVHVRRSTANPSSTWTELTCHSRCQLPDHLSYVWYNNNKPVGWENYFQLRHFNAEDRYHCAIEGQERFPSPTLYAPKPPSVSVSPSGEIMEGSSVTLTCSSDANPAAKYTWYKRSGDKQVQRLSEETQFVLSSIRSSDSGEYYCTAENELGKTASERVLINVKYAPQSSSVSVSPSGEIMEGSSVTLTCSSDANPAAHYTWYKENRALLQGPENVYHLSSIISGDSGVYSCKSENQYGQISSTSLHLDVQYAPKPPSVSVSSSGEIMEGSSVTLTCSSDANPAANYTWYKRSGDKQVHLHLQETQLVFSSILLSDSGEYYCTAENALGKTASKRVLINVKYAPKPPSVSVSPSGEIMEGSSVTLTCSSDANPAANYTWYKENRALLQGPEGVYHLSSISSGDSGVYCCKSENQYGLNSTSLHLDVQYAPKPPSVSVSSSGEIMEGSSVTLTCSSDANPAANYTWYKRSGDKQVQPKASGQNFTITDITAEHGGKYQCEAQNTHGRSNTTLHLTVGAVSPGAWKSAVTGTTTALLLVVVLLAVFLWIRRNKSFTQQRECGERPEDRVQIPAAAHTRPAEPHDDVHYASVCFTQNPADAIYCNIGRVQPQRETDEDEEEEAEYSAVRFDSATRTRREEEGDDPSAVYSTVTKH